MTIAQRTPTKTWRPDKRIKVKVLGLIWRGDAILACKVYTDDGRVKGIRPPGGSIEFGETRAKALVRELKEELAIEVAGIGKWIEFESIFEHQGSVGHEYVFVSEVTVAPQTGLDGSSFEIDEGGGIICIAEWFSLRRIEEEKLEVFPQGLRAAIFNS